MSAPDVRTPGTNPANAENQYTNKHADYAGCAAAARKSFLTLQARAALAGYALHELADGYLFCERDRARPLPDLRAVASVLLQIGGRHV